MKSSIKLISTDFDGTLFAEFENPPIPRKLERLIGDLQAQGTKWLINTGRDMSSLMESLARAHISIQPDYLVLVEREIHIHDGVRYRGIEEWNRACEQAHAELYARVRPDMPKLMDWVKARYKATVYEDVYSPFCMIADDNGHADKIHERLVEYAKGIPNLTVVRNDVYARFSHAAYNKGSALAEITQRLGFTAADVLAAGDHLNDLPMMKRDFAHALVAPGNAMPETKEAVRQAGGFVSKLPMGEGVAEGLLYFVEKLAQ